MPRVLTAEDITVRYNGKPVISGLSFAVEDGDVVCLIGPNGSGKTTLIKAVLGIIPIKGGRLLFFDGKRLGEIDAEHAMAYLPQRMELDRTFPISLREMLSLASKGARLDKYVDMLELGGLLDRRVGELSGGQFQRALLAYSLAKEPRLLVMDEPTSWVDAKGADCMLCVMEEFKKKGIAIMFASHDMGMVLTIATHVLGLGPGGSFFVRSDSPELDHMMARLLGMTHHGNCGI